MKTYYLSKRDVQSILSTLASNWPIKDRFSKIRQIKMVQIDERRSLLISKEFEAARLDKDILPLLQRQDILTAFPRVVIDTGAIRYICNGADIMRPGIVSFPDNFRKGDLVAVQEVAHHKFLAVGRALIDSEAAKTLSRGAVIENLHYIGDKFWEARKLVKD